MAEERRYPALEVAGQVVAGWLAGRAGEPMDAVEINVMLAAVHNEALELLAQEEVWQDAEPDLEALSEGGPRGRGEPRRALPRGRGE